MSLIGYQPNHPMERLIDRMMTNFYKDVDLFHRDFTPYWTGKRDALDFGGDEISLKDDSFGVSVDVSSFHPNELKVSLDGNQLAISGKHSEKSEHGEMHREFHRRYVVPDDIDVQQFKSSLGQDGKLKIEAPKKNKSLPQARTIPIEFSKM